MDPPIELSEDFEGHVAPAPAPKEGDEDAEREVPSEDDGRVAASSAEQPQPDSAPEATNSAQDEQIRNDAMAGTAEEKKKSWLSYVIPAERWRLALYLSYFLSSWSARMEEFATVVLLLQIFTGTLFFAAILGFATTSSAIVFGQSVGWAIDRSGRLFAIRFSLSLQKFAIVLISVLIFVLYKIYPSEPPGQPVSVAAGFSYALLVLMSAILRLANMGNSISLEKDWVVVASMGSSERLTSLNTSIRRIDLVCKVAAPLLVSLFIAVLPLSYTVLLLIIWNCVSFPFEYYFIGRVYRAVPGLSEPKPLELEYRAKAAEKGSGGGIDYSWMLSPSHHYGHVRNTFTRFVRDWKVYIHHPVLFPSLSVALLYFTVLSFGGITITYLENAGISTTAVAVARGIGVLAGIGATVAEHPMIKGMGLLRTGMVGLWGETACLVPLFALVIALQPWITLGPGHFPPPQLIYPMLACLACSRFFLWVADLTIEAQLMQEMTESEIRGRINGVHGSVCAAAELLQYIVVAIWSDPKDFAGLAGASVGSVALGAVVFTLWRIVVGRGKTGDEWWKVKEEGKKQGGTATLASEVDEAAGTLSIQNSANEGEPSSSEVLSESGKEK